MTDGGRLVVGVSGVRGVVGEGLTPEVAARFASAMGTYCRGGLVVVGRDTRPSGVSLRYAVVSGLLATGSPVVDVGVAATPSVQLAVGEHGAAGGVIITASHNPGEYNGLKFVSSRGIFLNAEEGARLRQISESGRFSFGGQPPTPEVRDDRQAAARHVARVLGLSYLDVARIRARRFRVVLDVGNGAGGRVASGLLEALGCATRVLHGEPSGVFARGPEPVAENLKALAGEVAARRADVGFALDPDGDRLSIVTEKGEAVGEEYSLALSAEGVLSRSDGGVVVTNLSTSRMVEAVAGRWGGRVVRTPVGEVHVSVRMMAEGAVIGGEGNGGVILPEAHYGRDAAVGIALVLELIADRGGSISEAVDGLPHYEMIKAKAPLEGDLRGDLGEVLAPLVGGADLDASDGLRASWPDAWLHVRKSGTEPVVRVVAEAEVRARAQALVEEALGLLARESGRHPMTNREG